MTRLHGLKKALEIRNAYAKDGVETHILYDSNENCFECVKGYNGHFTDRWLHDQGIIDVTDFIGKLKRKVNYANCRSVVLRYFQKDVAILVIATELYATYIDSMISYYVAQQSVAAGSATIEEIETIVNALSKTIENNLEQMIHNNEHITAGIYRKIVANEWNKGDNDRTYYEIRCYSSNYKHKHTYRCGYIDNAYGKYVHTRFDDVNALTMEYTGL